MRNYLFIVLAGICAPALSLASSAVGALDMHPYVIGREFPWVVPAAGLLCLAAYFVRVAIAYGVRASADGGGSVLDQR